MNTAQKLLDEFMDYTWISESIQLKNVYDIEPGPEGGCLEEVIDSISYEKGEIYKFHSDLTIFVNFPDNSKLKIGLFQMLIREEKDG